jgi:hypothetical protein
LLKSDNDDIKEQAAGALHNLAIDPDSRGVIVSNHQLPHLAATIARLFAPSTAVTGHQGMCAARGVTSTTLEASSTTPP